MFSQSSSGASRAGRAALIVALATFAFAVGAFLGGRGSAVAGGPGASVDPTRPPAVTPSPSAPAPESPSPAPSEPPSQAPTVEPSDEPSAEPSVEPEPEPSEEPEPEPSEPPRDAMPITVDLAVSGPHHVYVDIVDHPGVVVDARSGPASDGVSVDYGDLLVENVDDHTLQLTWSDRPGDNGLVLYIWRDGETVRLVLVQPPHDEGGDAILNDRSLIVELDEPVSADAIDAMIAESAS